MEKDLLDFVVAGCVAQVTGEGNPLVAVDALPEACFCVVPSKLPEGELVLRKQLSRSQLNPQILGHL